MDVSNTRWYNKKRIQRKTCGNSVGAVADASFGRRTQQRIKDKAERAASSKVQILIS